MDEIDFIQPKKTVGKLISIDVLDKIRTEIKSRCHCINILASILPYTERREIQELSCEIMDLFEIIDWYKAESEDK